MKSLITALILMCSTACFGESISPNRARTVMIDDVVLQNNMVPLGTQMMKWAADGSGAPVDLIINSPGGEVYAGFEFISQMESVKGSGTKIRCYTTKLAASMAFQILLHCSERYSLYHAAFLFHHVRVQTGPMVVTAPVATQMAKELKRIDADVIAELRDQLSLDDETFSYHFENETLHTGRGLNELDPDFFDGMYGYIPGLLDIVYNPGEIVHSSQFKRPSLFDFLKRGEIMYISPYYRAN